MFDNFWEEFKKLITDEYISPELSILKGEDKNADIYGIGVVLYEMVCGTKPFYSKENVNIFNNDFNKNKLMMNEYFSVELNIINLNK